VTGESLEDWKGQEQGKSSHRLHYLDGTTVGKSAGELPGGAREED
jgi:hypothetical protein